MPKPAQPIVLYGTALSGHAHRVELLLRMLGLDYRVVEADAEVRRTPAFLTLNPLGQIPVLVDGDLILPDSNAILVYLARRYDAGGPWLPEDPVGAARVQRWLSIAAGEVRYGPAKARFATLWGDSADAEAARAVAGRLLGFMDEHLCGRTFLALDHATVADLACYSYVAHAPEGAVSLDPYPHVRAWLARVEALPRFKPMPRSVRPATAA
jgi:glutathione S-transferase